MIFHEPGIAQEKNSSTFAHRFQIAGKGSK